MSTIFAIRPGYALAVREATAAPLLIGLAGWGDIASGGGFANQKAIITGFTLGESPNYQIQHTLRNFLYAYQFGNRAGEMAISGIAFAGRCDAGNSFPGTGGFDRVLQFYRRSRLSTRPLPLGIAIGGVSFLSLLVGCRLGADNPQAGLCTYNLELKNIPDS
jgi:hypothetical protein